MKKCPTQFQIFGERNSGTNYIEKLLENNITNFKVTTKFGWKHGLCGVHPPDKLNRRTVPIVNKHENVVFVIIARNVCDWLKSMHAHPWHLYSLQGLDFSQFIKESPITFQGHAMISTPDALIFNPDLNPDTNEKYNNLIQMRTVKYREWFKIKSKVRHFVFVNYDKVIVNPKKFIYQFCRKFRLRSFNIFHTIKFHKGKKKEGKFKKKTYTPIYPHDLKFIVKNLDKKQELKMGFQLHV
jgi:hypothetical protein